MTFYDPTVGGESWFQVSTDQEAMNRLAARVAEWMGENRATGKAARPSEAMKMVWRVARYAIRKEITWEAAEAEIRQVDHER